MTGVSLDVVVRWGGQYSWGVLAPMKLQLGAPPPSPSGKCRRARNVLGRLIEGTGPLVIHAGLVRLGDYGASFGVWHRGLNVPGRPARSQATEVWVERWVGDAVSAYKSQGGFAGLTLVEWLAKLSPAASSPSGDAAFVGQSRT